ncbi:MAG: HEPN domain-containing protein [Candidatus Scalindua sp. AMX11]|nr:MAG: HEPN domain-containing protein [Candidatus Scalindua sp.]NOG83173.1 HEPN domain-containing protein [Planctomycetota bacterium]RZV77601.1 MAG: HEPN domain-containing protein [Candidatus Scalindua sp. SCAELEC01]TDE64580.1 MAG: HEPN domain-containing protein [Candidatus Scalindua sp. AMX11]
MVANLNRATEAINAARSLFREGYPDFATSRAYYSVFYTATALLLCEGLEFKKYSGVIAYHTGQLTSGVMGEYLVCYAIKFNYEKKGISKMKRCGSGCENYVVFERKPSLCKNT